MDVTRMIQVAVARADLFLCSARALPWGRMALSLGLAAAAIHVLKVVRNGG